jgi:hypothetical protein
MVENKRLQRWMTAVVSCALFSVLGAQSIGQSTQTLPTPVELTAEQDQKLMLQQLHISSLRAGANPNAAVVEEWKASDCSKRLVEPTSPRDS